MNLIIPADAQERVSALLKMGRYTSEGEILRAAVTALEEQNADITAIQGGIIHMERGRSRLFAEFEVEFRERNQVDLKHELSGGANFGAIMFRSMEEMSCGFLYTSGPTMVIQTRVDVLEYSIAWDRSGRGISMPLSALVETVARPKLTR